MPLSDSMEEGQIDQDDVQITSGDDHTKSTTQIMKGTKVLATPAVRRLAMENNVISFLVLPLLGVGGGNAIVKLSIKCAAKTAQGWVRVARCAAATSRAPRKMLIPALACSGLVFSFVCKMIRQQLILVIFSRSISAKFQAAERTVGS